MIERDGRELPLSERGIDDLGSPRLLVIGDLILDEYVWGAVSRVSPEAPVPVIAGHHREWKAGGAASVVENLAVLGARVQVCGLLGDDEAGERFRELLARRGVSHRGLVSTTGRTTTRKVRVMASVQQASRAQQQICRVDWEDCAPPTAEELRRLEGHLDEAFADPPAAVLVSDYEKGLLSAPLLRSVIDRSRRMEVPVLIDPGRSVDYETYRDATLLCPNRFEAQRATGIEMDESDGFQACAERLLQWLGLEHVALTLDRDGIFLASRQAPCRHFPTRARAVSDVAGAGDMVLSLLGIALGSGWGLEDAVLLANAGAGLEVTKVGVTPVERWELAQALAEQVGVSHRVCTVEELQRSAARARAAGRSIVFANGCFDLLHVGHVVLLQKARSLGDVLVVGLNSDDSIRRLKGESRPILRAEERAAMLAPYADHIVFFDDDTPLHLIELLRPDVLVKGADYANRRVVGREIVERAGGRVELVPLRPEISTSSILERIRRNEQGEAPGE